MSSAWRGVHSFESNHGSLIAVLDEFLVLWKDLSRFCVKVLSYRNKMLWCDTHAAISGLAISGDYGGVCAERERRE